MYGFGSKKALIEDFASTSLTEYSVFVINGYLQSINIKQVSSAQIKSKVIHAYFTDCYLYCYIYICRGKLMKVVSTTILHRE
jgi:hypothetical protein